MRLTANRQMMMIWVQKDKMWGSIGLICGFIWGLVWLLPFYRVPENPPILSLPAGIRTLRMFVPLIVGSIPLVFGAAKIGVRRFASVAVVLTALVFLIFPIVAAWRDSFYVEGVLFGLLPMITSFVFIWMVALGPENFWKHVLVGIGFIACGLVALRLARNGLEFSTYYLRPRAHLGFYHPTLTGAVILAIFWGIVAIVASWKSKMRQVVVLLPSLVMTVLGVLYADSRNSLLFLVLWLIGVSLYFTRNVLGRFCVRFATFILWLFVPISVALVQWAWTFKSESQFAMLSKLTSGRLYTSGKFVEGLASSGFSLLGSGWAYTHPHGIRGFALVDSTFLSYWGHFGFLAFACFLLLWLWLGMRIFSGLQSTPMNVIGAGAWFGLTGYYLFDSQGLTVSNPALFLPFAWLVRVALINPVGVQRQR